MVTDKGEIHIRKFAIARGDYLAVRLDRDRGGYVKRTRNSSSHLARAPEARIERAVSIVTDKGEIQIRPVIAIARGNYLAVRLYRDRVGLVNGIPNRSRHLAVAIE